LRATLSITRGKKVRRERKKGWIVTMAVEYCREEDCDNISKIPRTMIMAVSLGLRRKAESV